MANNLAEEAYSVDVKEEYRQYDTLSIEGSDEFVGGVVTTLFEDSPPGSYGEYDSTRSLSGQSDIVLSPGVDHTVFSEPTPPPAAIQSLAQQPDIWQFLNQSTYNCVSRTSIAYPYLTDETACVLVNKLSFPRDAVYVYHTQEQKVSVQKGQRNYVCNLTSTHQEIQLQPKPIGPVIPMQKGPQRIFVLNPTGLYQISLSRWEIITITVNPDHIVAITQIIQADSRESTQAYLRLTSASMHEIRAVCPNFCSDLNLSPEAHNHKFRTARLFAQFYPNLQVFAVSDRQLIMPYFEHPVTDDEIIQESIRIFVEYHRILADLCIAENFKKNHDGKVYCVDPDMAFSTIKRSLSRGSLVIQQEFISTTDPEGSLNAYNQFLQQRLKAQPRLTRVLLGMLALFDHIPDVHTIPKEWVTEDWLNLVYVFDYLSFPLEISDLEVLHLFADTIHAMSNPDNPPSSGMDIYYDCLRYLIETKDVQNLHVFLDTLAEDTVSELCTIQDAMTLLSAAVLTRDPAVVTELLEWDPDPLLQDGGGEQYHAIDWAILQGDWNMLPALMRKRKIQQVEIAPRRYTLWSAQPTRVMSLEEAVPEMEALDNLIRYHHHLQAIRALAIGQNSKVHLDFVYTLIQFGYQYFSNQHTPLAERNHTFIKNCDRALRQQLPALADAGIQSTMTLALAGFKQALSTARPKQSTCMIM